MAIQIGTALNLACVIIGSVVGLFTSYALAGQQYDMLGLSPGMTPDTVQKTISSKYADLTLHETRDESGRNVGSIIALRLESNSQPIERIVVLFTDNNPRAWFLGHEIIFDEHKGPLVTNLHASLITKYGQVSGIYQAPGDHTLWQAVWLFDPSGKQINLPPKTVLTGYVQRGHGSFPCGTETTWFEGDAASAGGIQLGMPGEFSELCGVSIVAKTAAPFNDVDVTRELVVRILDEHMRYLDLKLDDEQKRRLEEKEKAKELENAAKIHSPL